jgi:hypothetical protein
LANQAPHHGMSVASMGPRIPLCCCCPGLRLRQGAPRQLWPQREAWPLRMCVVIRHCHPCCGRAPAQRRRHDVPIPRRVGGDILSGVGCLES